MMAQDQGWTINVNVDYSDGGSKINKAKTQIEQSVEFTILAKEIQVLHAKFIVNTIQFNA